MPKGTQRFTLTCEVCSVEFTAKTMNAKACKDHRATRNREKRRQRYLLHKELGKCTNCGRDPKPGRTHCQSCLDARHKWSKKMMSRGLCQRCCKNDVVEGATQCIACKQRSSDEVKSAYSELRDEIFSEYGGKCTCCGESEVMMLNIDHVNNDGAELRKELGGKMGAAAYYRKIKKLGFPKDIYQILCYNCNVAKYKNGGSCPHNSVAR